MKQDRLTRADRQLVDAAKKARLRAHVQHSQFKVGAAARYGGSIVLGCNVESDVYGLTNCAERTAIFSAHATGAASKPLHAIAVVADTPEPVAPCGACRQVLLEQGGAGLRVIMTNLRGDIRIATIGELLPGCFRLESTHARAKKSARKKSQSA
ncbi:MAG TPA: cytidine deaminase [Rudaea sp.]|uniref:cytidine deaminase n=1 Tax=Rudaea sp. TaxID=2136325 RepID=UPI002F95F111